MVAELGTAVRMPRKEDTNKAITAFFTLTSTGGTKADTITLDNDYPPIDLTIQSPILGIFMIADETGVAIDDPEIFLPTGQVDRGDAADSAGEFAITGARTISVYHEGDQNGKGMVTYVPKGSSQLT